MVRHATPDITMDIIIISIHLWIFMDKFRLPKTRNPCTGCIMVRHISRKSTIPFHHYSYRFLPVPTGTYRLNRLGAARLEPGWGWLGRPAGRHKSVCALGFPRANCFWFVLNLYSTKCAARKWSQLISGLNQGQRRNGLNSMEKIYEEGSNLHMV
jgi:hypothetical protein